MSPTIADGIRPGKVRIRGASLYVDAIGHGPPLVLMHGGPSADHWTLRSFRRLSDQFTLIFYDHRCNGRSDGVPVSSMTWDNLTADADALREFLGFERWAVLGHSFGGHVALEYALRHPDRVLSLVLLDTGADAHWARDNVVELLAQRGWSPEKVELARRWFTGELAPEEFYRIFLRIGGLYNYHPLLGAARSVLHGGWRSKARPEALIYAGHHLLNDWSVVERLDQITAPTLVIAGHDDVIFPPECQRELAAGIPRSHLKLVDHAGHNPHDEQSAEVLRLVRKFLSVTSQATPL